MFQNLTASIPTILYFKDGGSKLRKCIFQITRGNVPEDGNLHSHRRENFNPYIFQLGTTSYIIFCLYATLCFYFNDLCSAHIFPFLDPKFILYILYIISSHSVVQFTLLPFVGSFQTLLSHETLLIFSPFPRGSLELNFGWTLSDVRQG